MNKRLLSSILAVMIITLSSCGDSSSPANKTAEDNSITSEESQAAETDPTDTEQDEQAGEAAGPEDMTEENNAAAADQEEAQNLFKSAEPFSGGYAWVQKKEDCENGIWKCIDTNGNIVFECKCNTVGPFSNGYAVIDNAYVIDTAGNKLYDFGAEGYELIDTKPLDVGCLILSKDIDTYEKSGTFSYVLDMEKKTVTEIDLSGCSYYTDSEKWGPFFHQYDYQSVDLLEYLGRGYYTLGLKEFDSFQDDGYPSSFRMIQWYDVKNNQYINIDSGIEFEDEGLPLTLRYFKTKDPDVYCVYFTQKDKIYFIDTKSCSIVNTIDGHMPGSGYYYRLTDVYPEDYLAFCADSARVWNNWEEGETWYLDFNTQEKFQMIPEYEEYEILAYNGDYFCLSLENDIGTYYLAVVDKTGKTVYSPVQYNHNSRFKPCFWGDHLIYHIDGELCFVSMADWTTEKRAAIQINSEYDTNERMCLTDIASPDVKYIIDFDTNSYYLPDGTAAAVNMEPDPALASPGVFENKLLVFHFYDQTYSYLNNDLTEFNVKY